MINLIKINTQEWIRLKFLQVVFFLSLAYVCISYLLGSLSFTEQMRIKYDLGLAGIELASLFVSAFMGTHALYRDIERKTFQVILARPISRWHLLVGYLGSLFTLNIILIFALGVTMAAFFEYDQSIFNLVISLMTIAFKALVIGSVGMMLSVLARPMFSLVLTLTFWILAYSVPDILYFIEKMSHENSYFFSVLFDYTVPRFYLFNWKSFLFLKSSVETNDIIWAWSHCLGWSFLFFAAASFFIRRKDIV